MRRPARLGATAAAVAIAVVGLADGSAPAAAAPLTTPTVTSPAAGQTLMGPVVIQVQSTAARVLVDYNRPSVFHGGHRIGEAVVTDGTATLAWETWGMPEGEGELQVHDCDEICSDQFTTVPLTLANGAPVITSPAAGSLLSGIVTATATAPVGGLQFVLEPQFSDAKTSDTPPHSATFDLTHSYADGPTWLRVTRCNATVCDGASATVAVTLASLHPGITRISPHVFSPNRDGYRESTTTTFTLDVAQSVTWEVRGLYSGALIRGPIALGRLASGAHTYTWNGRSNAGTRPADGWYKVVLRTTERWKSGKASDTFGIDSTPPVWTYRSGAGTTFYPYPDGFKDRFFAGIFTRDFSRTTSTLTIATQGGTVVRRLSGPVWKGYDASGSRVPAGRYRWRMSFVDKGGNRSQTPWYDVVVSWRRTADKTFTLALSPSSGVVTSDAPCATAGPSAYTGGIVLENTCGADAPETRVMADYAVTLPAAAAYTTVSFQVDIGSIAGGGTRAGLIAYDGTRYSTPADVPAASLGWWTAYPPSRASTWTGPGRTVWAWISVAPGAVGASRVDVKALRLVVVAKVFV